MTRRREPERPFTPLEGLSPSSLASPAPQVMPDARPTERRERSAMSETTLRTRLHPDDKRRVESLCVRLSESLRATVRPSNLMRALLLLAREVESSLHAEARGVHGLVRPANDDRRGMDAFERTLASVLRDSVASSRR